MLRARYLPAVIPAICYINRRTFAESVLVFFASRILHIVSFGSIVRLLQRLDRLTGRTVYARLRILKLDVWSSNLLNRDIHKLFKACGALRELHFNVSSLASLEKKLRDPSEQYKIHTGEQTRQLFDFGNVLSNPAL